MILSVVQVNYYLIITYRSMRCKFVRLFDKSSRFLLTQRLGLGSRAAIIHFITSHVSLSASLHSQTREHRANSDGQSQAELSSVLTNGRRDLGVGRGPVISAARPSVAKTRRLQNICATHPEPELRRSLETGRGEGNWRLGDIPESG